MGMDFQYLTVRRSLYDKKMELLKSVPSGMELVIYDERLNHDFKEAFEKKQMEVAGEYDPDGFLFMERREIHYSLREYLRSTRGLCDHVKGMKEIRLPYVKIHSWIGEGFFVLLLNKIDGCGIFDLSGKHEITKEKLERLRDLYNRIFARDWEAMMKDREQLFGYSCDEIYDQPPFWKNEFRNEVKRFRKDLAEAEKFLKEADLSGQVLQLEIY
ncbi:MAG: hypothetical protein J6Y62_07190 [Clostridia bacterium]|nr:hypothetical protein [Clostridia bacterium]